MSPGDNGRDAGTGDQQEEEQPILELVEHERPTSAEFVARVRGRIHRKAATAQLASFSWHLPKAILMEMASMLKHIFVSFGAGKDSGS